MHSLYLLGTMNAGNWSGKMPCIKCNNGKWKYGKRGKCIYKTLKACKAAAAAIHARDKIYKLIKRK